VSECGRRDFLIYSGVVKGMVGARSYLSVEPWV
jgi:hypothetical protein